MTSPLFSFKDTCECTRRFSQQYANLALHLLDCLSSVKKYCLGFSECHYHNIFTLQQPIRLQHFEQGNRKYNS